MQTWFTSDTHYNHKNIVAGTAEWEDKSRCRNFATLQEHNDTLVENFNKVVKAEDVLYHLGDWSFGGFSAIADFRNRLNCKTIHLIYGNHDHHIERNKEGIQSLFASVQYYKEISINHQRIVLLHYAMKVWHKSHHGSLHLFGHSHNTLPGTGKSMDVGIDTAFELLGQYQPFSWPEVQTILGEKPIELIDHHISSTN